MSRKTSDQGLDGSTPPLGDDLGVEVNCYLGEGHELYVSINMAKLFSRLLAVEEELKLAHLAHAQAHFRRNGRDD